MKKKNKKKNPVPTPEVEAVFQKIHIVLEEDLCNPDVEAEARQLLNILRSNGYWYPSMDLDDDCWACLHMALLGAESLGEELLGARSHPDEPFTH